MFPIFQTVRGGENLEAHYGYRRAPEVDQYLQLYSSSRFFVSFVFHGFITQEQGKLLHVYCFMFVYKYVCHMFKSLSAYGQPVAFRLSYENETEGLQIIQTVRKSIP